MRVFFTLREDEPYGYRKKRNIYVNLYWFGYDLNFEETVEFILRIELHEFLHFCFPELEEERIEKLERTIGDFLWKDKSERGSEVENNV